MRMVTIIFLDTREKYVKRKRRFFRKSPDLRSALLHVKKPDNAVFYCTYACYLLHVSCARG
jgi:hypothetical protein